MSEKQCAITYGTFDVMHYGHIRLLNRIAELGLPIYVGLSTNEFNTEKGKETVLSYEEREACLHALRMVEHVFPESSWDQKRDDIKKYNAKYFVMGDDWNGKFDDLADVVEVIYLPRTESISSTIIKASIANQIL